MSAWLSGLIGRFLAFLVGSFGAYFILRRTEAETGTKPQAANLKEAVYDDLLELIRAADVKWEDARERLSHMIDYAVNRHDYYERVRQYYMTVGLGLIAAATALQTLVVHLTTNKLYFLTVGALLAGLTGVALVFRFVYETSPDYPYRGVIHIRSWYHFYSLHHKRIFSLKPDKEEMAQEQLNFRNSLTSFAKEWLEWASKPTFDNRFLAEDFEQVFVLFVLQQYKRAFARKMGTLLLAGVGTFLVYLVSEGINYADSRWAPALWGVCIGCSLGGVAVCARQYLGASSGQ